MLVATVLQVRTETLSSEAVESAKTKSNVTTVTSNGNHVHRYRIAIASAPKNDESKPE